ncbi:MAG: translation initiation factor IF-3 [Rickettsiales bacterium]|jgi:translation initiation factor IF-3|nr:translation initiation factor IF-3 [Rickettsiales bacterium]
MFKELRINKAIRLPEVRLVDQNGDMVGVVSTSTALRMAQDAGMDLIEISPNVRPIVCKIANYSKMKYEANKNKKKQKISQIKEVGLSMNIGIGDLETKIKQAVKFIEKGDRVRFNFKFRGREITLVDNTKTIIDKIVDDTKEVAKLEEKPKLEGKKMFFTIVPLKNKAD